MGGELTGGVEGLLKDQDTFSSDTLTKLEDKGVKWYVGEKPITSVDDMKKWAGGQPTGWPVGSIYEDVGGVYNKKAKSVCVSILGELGSQSTIGHEAGHSIWHEILTSSQQQDFVRIQGDLYDDLGPIFNRVEDIVIQGPMKCLLSVWLLWYALRKRRLPAIPFIWDLLTRPTTR